MASELRVNYEKARVRPTTHDIGINSENHTFFNQSVVGVEGINITTMACLSAANVRNLELLAQIEERAAEDDLAIIQLTQNSHLCPHGGLLFFVFCTLLGTCYIKAGYQSTTPP